MTMRTMHGSLGVMIPPGIVAAGSPGAYTTLTVDAADEAVHFIGHVYLEAGSGSKTISSAGGKIHWRTLTGVTFANASTNFRIGIQDVSTANSPAQGDGTFDTYADLVGGTDSLANNTAYATAIETGSKTLSHGDKIAIVFSLTARGGTDAVTVSAINSSTIAGQELLSPAVMSYVPTTYSPQSSVPCAIIEFDDGTLGWLMMSFWMSSTSTVTYNSGTGTADEYGNLIKPPVPMIAIGAYFHVLSSNNAADFEVCLYSDPLGIPSLIEAVSVDVTTYSRSGAVRPVFVPFSTPRKLSAETVYGVSIRPTTTNGVTAYYFDVPAASHFISHHLDADRCYAIRRLDNSGAFSDYNGGTAQTRRMNLSLMVNAFNDSAGAAVSAIGL